MKAEIRYRAVHQHLNEICHTLQVGYQHYHIGWVGENILDIYDHKMSREDLRRIFWDNDAIYDARKPFIDHAIGCVPIVDGLWLAVDYAWRNAYPFSVKINRTTGQFQYNCMSRRVWEQCNKMHSMILRVSEEKLMTARETIQLLRLYLMEPYHHHLKPDWEGHMNNMADNIIEQLDASQRGFRKRNLY